MYDSACAIVKRGLEEAEADVDLLSDFIKYGILCGRQEECDRYFRELKDNISMEEWNWRAFSFSIDYLLDKLDHTRNRITRETLKNSLIELADDFIRAEGSDQSYFDKALDRVF